VGFVCSIKKARCRDLAVSFGFGDSTDTLDRADQSNDHRKASGDPRKLWAATAEQRLKELGIKLLTPPEPFGAHMKIESVTGS
jgi:hypothetical protein